jgi:hypothetical protein
MSSEPTARAGSALAWAEEAHALVQARPRQALALAERALAAASSEGDVKAAVAARYALGWAQNVLGDARAARVTMSAGIRLAERHGDRQGAGLMRRHMAFLLALAGKTRAAHREIDAAIALLSGRERARSQVHRVAIHRRAHIADPEIHRRVLADAAGAVRALRREGDEIWEARLLYNRGALHFDRGELGRAEDDFKRALTLYGRVGAKVGAADTVLALAEVALLRGDLLTCLKTLEAVQPTLPPGYLSNLDECRMLALVQARLLPEARAAAEAYVELYARAGRDDHVTTAMLELATVALMSADPTAARRLATRAGRTFAARRKPVNAALARGMELRARLFAGEVNGSAIRSGLAAAATLDTAGWRREALRTRLIVARAGLAIGSRLTARRQLALAEPLRAGGSVSDRIELCHVRALLRIADGDRLGAERQISRGLGLLDDYRAALGAVELRVAASSIGTELSELGLRLALESRLPKKILAWAERQRANALRVPPVRPPADAKLRSLQVELRRRTAQPSKRGAARQVRLEAAIRARARLIDSDGDEANSLPDVRDAARALGERALIEYIEVDGTLHALTMARGSLVLHTLEPQGTGEALEWLRFAFGRLAARRMTATESATTRSNAEASAVALDDLLVKPLLAAIGEASLVLVPTGALHALPWAALPSLHGRQLTVAPSLAIWTGLATRPRSRRRKVVLIGGPRLRHADAEIRELAELLPRAVALLGKEATAKATLRALDGAALAHLACHGHFRADSPLFSSLELADGLLNVYELQRLRLTPEIVILSACELARSSLQPGDELLGLAAALLSMGTRTIVASVVQIPDAAARRLMLSFHRHLHAGDSPAAALARAQSSSRIPAFVCLGNG